MSSFIRLFTSEALAEGVNVELSERQHHYLHNVMRRGLGDDVALFNGCHGEWRGTLEYLNKKAGTIKISGQLRPQKQETDLWLVFALLKRGPTDLVTEKATELGISRLCPVITGRTNSNRVNLGRLKAIAIESAEQCGRLSVPKVDKPQKLDQLLSEWPRGRGLVLLDETGDGKPIAEVMTARSCGRGDAILIGPEGGFEPAELDNLRKLSFVTPTVIGRRLIRAETAAIATLATWQALAGDWCFGSGSRNGAK